MWGRCMSDEELRCVRIEPAIGHREDSGIVVLHVRMENIVEPVGLPTIGVYSGLNDESGNDPVPFGAIVEPRLRQVDEVLDVDIGDVVVQVGFNCAFGSFNRRAVRPETRVFHLGTASAG